jgi:hypothetical protein
MTAWLIGAGLGLLGFIAGCMVMAWQHADDYVDGFEDCADLLNGAVDTLIREVEWGQSSSVAPVDAAVAALEAAQQMMERVLQEARDARENAPLQ